MKIGPRLYLSEYQWRAGLVGMDVMQKANPPPAPARKPMAYRKLCDMESAQVT